MLRSPYPPCVCWSPCNFAMPVSASNQKDRRPKQLRSSHRIIICALAWSKLVAGGTVDVHCLDWRMQLSLYAESRTPGWTKLSLAFDSGEFIPVCPILLFLDWNLDTSQPLAHVIPRRLCSCWWMLTNVAEWQQASDYGLDSVVIMCIQHQNVGAGHTDIRIYKEAIQTLCN